MNRISDSGLSTQPDGQLLLGFARNGDQSAFSELIRRHGPMVLRMCRRISGGDLNIAEDASQQVFLALANNALALSTRTSIAGWLYRTAWHVMTRLRRQRSIRVNHEHRAAEMRAAQVSAAEAGTIPFALVTEEFSDAMGRALATLPETYRDALVLHHFAGHTVGETAKILGVKIGTAASWLSRGRATLRTRLDGFGAVTSTEIALWFVSQAQDEDHLHTSAPQDSNYLARLDERSWLPHSSYASGIPAAATAIPSGAAGVSTFVACRWIVAAVVLSISGTTLAAGGPAAAVEAITSILNPASLNINQSRAKDIPAADVKKKDSSSPELVNKFRPLGGGTGAPSAIPEPASGAMMLGAMWLMVASRNQRRTGGKT
jgi:RNA polymerase sigma factor (sigma-70 family)